MPRRPRIHRDGVPLHIVQRGHNREPCFFAEEDYHAYLHGLGEAVHKEALAGTRVRRSSGVMESYRQGLARTRALLTGARYAAIARELEQLQAIPSEKLKGRRKKRGIPQARPLRAGNRSGMLDT